MISAGNWYETLDISIKHPKMITREEVYNIGRIGKPHGVKGETTLRLCDDVFGRTDAGFLVLEIEGILVPFFIEEYRFRSDSVALVKFFDVDTQEQASALTGCDVFFMRKFADNGKEGITPAQIVGFRLTDTCSGNVVGTVTRVDDSTMNTLFEVLTSGGEHILIPASEELIEETDWEGQEIRMAVPDGILDLK